MKLVFRMLVLACYFLPFSFYHFTCAPGFAKVSYNEREMQEDEKMAKELWYSTTNTYAVSPNDTLPMLVSGDTMSSTIGILPERSVSTNILHTMIEPAHNTCSAIGNIFFYKNWTGKILSALSVKISVILLICLRLFSRSHVPLYLSVLNFIIVNLLVLFSWFSDISLIWGAWTLYVMLFAQVVIEWVSRRKPNRNHEPATTTSAI